MCVRACKGGHRVHGAQATCARRASIGIGLGWGARGYIRPVSARGPSSAVNRRARRVAGLARDRYDYNLASCTPSSVIPVGHSSEATRRRPNSAKLCPTPTPHPSDLRPTGCQCHATCTVTLSTLWRVLPYRLHLLSPTTAPSALDTVFEDVTTWRHAEALMTVTYNGGIPFSAHLAR